jgi:hypothetical protein
MLFPILQPTLLALPLTCAIPYAGVLRDASSPNWTHNPPSIPPSQLVDSLLHCIPSTGRPPGLAPSPSLSVCESSIHAIIPMVPRPPESSALLSPLNNRPHSSTLIHILMSDPPPPRSPVPTVPRSLVNMPIEAAQSEGKHTHSPVARPPSPSSAVRERAGKGTGRAPWACATDPVRGLTTLCVRFLT